MFYQHSQKRWENPEKLWLSWLIQWWSQFIGPVPNWTNIAPFTTSDKTENSCTLFRKIKTIKQLIHKKYKNTIIRMQAPYETATATATFQDFLSHSQDCLLYTPSTSPLADQMSDKMCKIGLFSSVRNYASVLLVKRSEGSWQDAIAFQQRWV